MKIDGLIALLAGSFLVACASAEPAPVSAAPAVACEVPEGMVLMPRTTGDQAMKDLKELDEALDSCIRSANKCRVSSNCS